MAALPRLADVIARHDLAPRKSLGQNFLLDLNLTAKIARAAAPFDGMTVIEVGPGPGGLTRALLDQGAQVIAVERDRRCLPALDEIADAYPGSLTIVSGDALDTDIATLARGPYKICANLPYNIATALFARWVEAEPWPGELEGMVLMFQAEVADRLRARARSKAYGRLSVLTQWRLKVEKLFDIPPRAFTPAPKVTSTVMRFTARPDPLRAGPPGALSAVTRAAFGQRRKMLRTSLKTLEIDAGALLAECGIDQTARAETLDIEQFCALAEAYGTMAPK